MFVICLKCNVTLLKHFNLYKDVVCFNAFNF